MHQNVNKILVHFPTPCSWARSQPPLLLESKPSGGSNSFVGSLGNGPVSGITGALKPTLRPAPSPTPPSNTAPAHATETLPQLYEPLLDDELRQIPAASSNKAGQDIWATYPDAGLAKVGGARMEWVWLHVAAHLCVLI